MRSETRLRFYVTNEMIYHFYFGEFELGKKYSAPWRNDSAPSLVFRNMGTFEEQQTLWFDFGLTEVPRHDGLGFVMQLYELSHKDAVRRVWDDMVRDLNVQLIKPKLIQPLNLPYTFKAQPIQDFEMEYWSTLFLSKSFLKFFNVHSLKSLKRVVGKVLWSSSKSNPTFIYLFSKLGAFKAYRPLDPFKDKFRGQNNGDVLEGYDQLPRSGEHLFVMSSLKDSMVMRRLGYLTLNPTSENSRRALLSKVRELNQRFKNIYIFFDNDMPGIRAARSLARDTNWGTIMLPTYSTKDPSDLIQQTKTYLYLSILLSKLTLRKYHL